MCECVYFMVNAYHIREMWTLCVYMCVHVCECVCICMCLQISVCMGVHTRVDILLCMRMHENMYFC